MASPNAPKSSAQLIREYSKARYLNVNAYDHFGPPAGTKDARNSISLASAARDQLSRKFR